MREYFLNIMFFCLIALIESVIWTYVDDNEMSPAEKKKFHIPLLLLRSCWFVLMLPFIGFIKTAGLVLCYPMWHLGVMYYYRNQLNPKIYKRRFFDISSNSSSAALDNVKLKGKIGKYINYLLELPFWLRFAAFLFGTIVYFI